jgi:hypothetical protein
MQFPTIQRSLKDVLVSIKDKVTTGTDAAVPILKVISAAADAFPSLKSAAEGALFISQAIQVCFDMRFRHERPLISSRLQDYRSDNQEWKDFDNYVQEMVARVVVTALKNSTSNVLAWSDHINTLAT